MKELLLHACCGPCATYPTEHLLLVGKSPTLFFYNPNIHPYQEQKLRREGLIQLAEVRNLPYLIEPGYELEDFLGLVAANPNERCQHCYRIRLTKTAQKAKELGLEVFSTTLLISPYQNQELIIKLGQELALEYNLIFEASDFRPGFRQSQNMARELGLYRQKYCGCIYSEKERFYQQK